MAQPTPRQKLTIGLYVGVLSIIVLVIWGFFLKYEFKTAATKTAELDNTFSDIGEKFESFFSQGKEIINNTKSEFQSLTSQQSGVPQNLVESVTEKTQAKLREKRIVDWLAFSNDEIGFKYPADWFIESTAEKIIISNHEDSKELEETGVKFQTQFYPNQDNYTPSQWWEVYGKDIDPDNSLPTVTIELAGRIALKRVIPVNPNEPYYSEIIHLSFNQKMIEIIISYDMQNQELVQIAEDFIQTIVFITK
ncbi:hypothetical protein KKF32_00525 [Patescibacteria group bacterium]|nr:hypothetical protein [Patescibacteria group bacterium]